MAPVEFSIVIATFNRAHLIDRAFRSITRQDWPGLEVIVVDDASTDHTERVVRSFSPTVQYLRHPVNRGCGAARNWGIREATKRWVLILDDDDTLSDDALSRIAQCICYESYLSYPILQFAHGNGSIPLPFMVVSLEDYLRGTLVGDFFPIINREVFLREGFAYPEIRSAGEHVLWWDIAERFGIPTWEARVGQVHSDAPLRLTSFTHQLLHPLDYAKLQELDLKKLAGPLGERFPKIQRKKQIGAATYRLLAGDRVSARSHLCEGLKKSISSKALILWLLTFMPLSLVRKLFVVFRRVERVTA